MTELEKRASRMKWSPPAPGSKERNEMPASAFLSPSTKTFPYKVLIDGQWVVSVPGLRSAISVANFRGNSGISAKASRLLEELTSDEAEHSGLDELQHHGVLGMKWGVRKDYDDTTIRRSDDAATRLAKAEARLGRKLKGDDASSAGSLTNKAVSRIQRHDVLRERYSQVKKKNDPGFDWMRGYDPTLRLSIGEKGVERIIRKLEKKPASSAMSAFRIEQGKKLAQKTLVSGLGAMTLYALVQKYG